MQSGVIYSALVLAVLFEMAVSETRNEGQALDVCFKETGIDEKDINKFFNATKEEQKKLEPQMKKLSTCFYKKMEAIDDSGNFDVDKLVQIFKDHLDDVKNVIEKCVKDAESIQDLEERIFSVDKCIFKSRTADV